MARVRVTHRRRWAMMCVSLMTIANGLIVAESPFAEPGPNVYYLIPVPVRVALWIGPGLAAFTIAAFKARRAERVGWFLLLLMPAERLVGHLLSLVLSVLPGDRYGTPESAAYALLWAGGTGLVVLMAGWRDSILDELAEELAAREAER